MKSHITATIDEELVERVKRYGVAEQRSRSQIIEMALAEFLRSRDLENDEIVTSEGRFDGNFSRAETYERG